MDLFTFKGKQLTMASKLYGVKRFPFETDRQLKDRLISYIKKHKPGFLRRDEYEMIKETYYYAFWKLNKCCRQLKNVIKQEIKKILKNISLFFKRKKKVFLVEIDCPNNCGKGFKPISKIYYKCVNCGCKLKINGIMEFKHKR